MAPLITEGIILKRKDYRESDLIVTAFTRDFGKITGIAFGAKKSRKRFANCLGFFARSRLYVSFPLNRDAVCFRSGTERKHTASGLRVISGRTDRLTDRRSGQKQGSLPAARILSSPVGGWKRSRRHRSRIRNPVPYAAGIQTEPGNMRALRNAARLGRNGVFQHGRLRVPLRIVRSGPRRAAVRGNPEVPALYAERTAAGGGPFAFGAQGAHGTPAAFGKFFVESDPETL